MNILSLRTLIICASALLTLPLTAETISSSVNQLELGPSLARERDAALNRALDFLISQQNEKGYWSDPRYPALTAIPALAFIRSDHPKKDTVIAKAIAHITSMAQKNGAIYMDIEGRKGGGLMNYNTAISIVTLHETGQPELRKYVLKGREFLRNGQRLNQEDDYNGGWGYDNSTKIKRSYTDLLNTYYTLEGMTLTASAEEFRPKDEPKVTVSYSEAVTYIDRVNAASDDGGFPYRHDDSPSGSTTNAAGIVKFNSYGSMTYAGTLALLYAKVKIDDPRVREALKWTQEHWTLAENPGMGQEGRFFHYNIMTKCLNAAGLDIITRKDGGQHNWRQALAKELVEKQKIDKGMGYWVNENNRWMEGDKALTTAYSVLSLQMAKIQTSE